MSDRVKICLLISWLKGSSQKSYCLKNKGVSVWLTAVNLDWTYQAKKQDAILEEENCKVISKWESDSLKLLQILLNEFAPIISEFSWLSFTVILRLH